LILLVLRIKVNPTYHRMISDLTRSSKIVTR
jgi:hypothetical protein